MKNFSDEERMVSNRECLPDGTGSRGQSAVQKEVTFGTGIQVQGSTLISIASRGRSTSKRKLPLCLIQDGETELSRLFDKRVRISRFRDRDPQTGRMMSDFGEERDRHCV